MKSAHFALAATLVMAMTAPAMANRGGYHGGPAIGIGAGAAVTAKLNVLKIVKVKAGLGLGLGLGIGGR